MANSSFGSGWVFSLLHQDDGLGQAGPQDTATFRFHGQTRFHPVAGPGVGCACWAGFFGWTRSGTGRSAKSGLESPARHQRSLTRRGGGGRRRTARRGPTKLLASWALPFPEGEKWRATPVSLWQLRYLVALSQTLNFRKAADQLFVTQSMLSAGIKKLESLLVS